MKLVNLRKAVMASLALCCFCSLSWAGEIEDEVKKAKSKTGEILRCSPAGKVPGTLSLEETIKKAQPGNVIQFLPGSYRSTTELFIFDQDNLIVEGDGSGGYVDLGIILYGRDCIVRNIFAAGIEGGGNLLAFDSKTRGFLITGDESRKGKTTLYNCCMNSLSIYPNMQDITIKNCSIITGAEVSRSEVKVVQTWGYGTVTSGGGFNDYSIVRFGSMNAKGDLRFEKCVIYSQWDLFAGGNKMLDLDLKDNIIYAGHSLIAVRKDTPEIKDISAIWNYFASNKKNTNLMERPIFNKDPKGHWALDKDHFLITPSSPGYDKGCGVLGFDSKGMPITPDTSEPK